ncbi:MAG: PKD domain-containing protein [Saprospirales bacterium]|nr:PKD domain-containing protein [Saprospirales bacterium]
MKTPLLGLALLVAAPLWAQQRVHSAQLNFTSQADGSVRFATANMTPLQTIPGATAPYWQYYWEFGDGDFSFSANPAHRYKAAGNHRVRLYATNIYDDGIPPALVENTVALSAVTAAADTFSHVLATPAAAVGMHANRNARAEEDLVCILSYRNPGTAATAGRLHLFVNEKNARAPHFIFENARAHHSEAQLAVPPASAQTLINETRSLYHNEYIWDFPALGPGQIRNLFVTLKGTPAILQDTGKLIRLRGVFAPSDPGIPAEGYTLELRIVRSHDPNDMSVSHSWVDCRAAEDLELEYLIRFQNEGDGPAQKIALDVELPNSLNAATLSRQGWYPSCDTCLETRFTKTGVRFTLDNIHLPGRKETRRPNPDSTQGFLRFRIKPAEDKPREPIKVRAHITFDQNGPIATNYATTRFETCPPLCCCCPPAPVEKPPLCMPGTSAGAKGGYAFASGDYPGEYPFFGLSTPWPHKPERIYLQSELLLGLKGDTPLPDLLSVKIDTLASPHSALPDTLITRVEKETRRRFVAFEFPMLLRKDFSRYFGLGLGASARLFFEKSKDESTTTVTTITHSATGAVSTSISPPALSSTETGKTRLWVQVFVDFSFGDGCRGPVLGLRPGVVLNEGYKLFVQASLEVKF